MGYFDRRPTPKPAPFSTTGVSSRAAPRPATKSINTALFLGGVALMTLLLSPRSRVFEWSTVARYVNSLIWFYVLRYVLSRWWRDLNEVSGTRAPSVTSVFSALVLGAGLIATWLLASGPQTERVWRALIFLAWLFGPISLFFPTLLLWFRDRFHLVFILLNAILLIFA